MKHEVQYEGGTAELFSDQFVIDGDLLYVYNGKKTRAVFRNWKAVFVTEDQP